jgi:hypothetical protein
MIILVHSTHSVLALFIEIVKEGNINEAGVKLGLVLSSLTSGGIIQSDQQIYLH